MADAVDDTDRELLARLQQDATTPYAALGEAVGLSATSAHDRVRKLRDRGVIRRTTIDVDPSLIGRPSLAFVLIRSTAWMGDESTAAALRGLPWVEEAHIIAGAATVLVKIRARDNTELQGVLRRLHDIDGVSGTETVVVLETVFERPTDVGAPGPHADAG